MHKPECFQYFVLSIDILSLLLNHVQELIKIDGSLPICIYFIDHCLVSYTYHTNYKDC